MELLNNYLFTSSPPQTRINNNGKKHIISKIEDLPKVYKKRSESLMSIYSSRFNEMTSPLPSNRTIHEYIPSPDRRQSPKARNTITSLIIRNKNHKTVEISTHATHAVNQYAEQLRITLVNQYNIQKKLSSIDQHSDNTIESNAMKQLEILKQIHPPKKQYENQTTLSTKTMAFKTLNLLYKAIIDNSYHNRKKQDFQLQANRLPMVERAHLHEKKPQHLNHKLREQPQQNKQKPQVYESPTVTIVRRTRNIHPSSHIQRQQQLQIIPWTTSQQLLL